MCFLRRPRLRFPVVLGSKLSSGNVLSRGLGMGHPRWLGARAYSTPISILGVTLDLPLRGGGNDHMGKLKKGVLSRAKPHDLRKAGYVTLKPAAQPTVGSELSFCCHPLLLLYHSLSPLI